jgi:pyruvate dehydrogenase E2 component (dihydrolipoamide acetyltransferase)
MGLGTGGVLTQPLTPGPGVKGEVTIVELGRLERSVARRSAETRAIVPSVELLTEVELADAPPAAPEAWLATILTVVGRALRRFPRLNGAYRDGHYELYSRVNIGISLPTPEGTASATLFDADGKEPAAIELELAELSERASAGRLSAAELSGATFTVIGPAPGGVTLLTPLIQPPQAAALAIGPSREAAVVQAGAVTVGRKLPLTLACDHRIVHVSEGSEFLAQVKAALEAGSA